MTKKSPPWSNYRDAFGIRGTREEPCWASRCCCEVGICALICDRHGRAQEHKDAHTCMQIYTHDFPMIMDADMIAHCTYVRITIEMLGFHYIALLQCVSWCSRCFEDMESTSHCSVHLFLWKCGGTEVAVWILRSWQPVASVYNHQCQACCMCMWNCFLQVPVVKHS